MRHEWTDAKLATTFHVEGGNLFTHAFEGGPVQTSPDGMDGEALLREASRLAEENRALKAESEEYQLFGGELIGRLGLDREEMEQRPEAVGNQILAVIDERQARIATLEARLRICEARLEDMTSYHLECNETD